MPWSPSTDFENEIVSFQPDHDYIYGSLNDSQEDQAYFPRPESHLQFIKDKKKKKQELNENASSRNRKLNIISRVQRIAGTKPLGEQPTLEDWDDDENVERETIAMMRHLGLQPSIEESLREDHTIATAPITEDMLIMNSGPKRIPILYNEKFFKLKPRNSFDFENDEETKVNANQSLTSQCTSENASIETVSNSASTTSGNPYKDSDSTKNEDYFEISRSSWFKENFYYNSSEEDSYTTACCNSNTSSPIWRRPDSRSDEERHDSTSSRGSKSSSKGTRNSKDIDKQKPKKAEERYLTTKELYFKHRKN